MRYGLLLIAFVLNAVASSTQTDTFPDQFIGKWVLIGQESMGYYSQIPQSDTNDEIIITKDSLCFFNRYPNKDSMIYIDSCYCDSINPNKFSLGGYCTYLLHGDTLIDDITNYLPGGYNYYYLRDNTEVKKTYPFQKTEKIHVSKPTNAFYNIRGQKINGSFSTQTAISPINHSKIVFLKGRQAP